MQEGRLETQYCRRCSVRSRITWNWLGIEKAPSRHSGRRAAGATQHKTAKSRFCVCGTFEKRSGKKVGVGQLCKLLYV